MRDMLFLSHRIPYPPTKGDKIRAWHFFQHLAERYRMHLGCFIDDEADLEHVPTLRAMCASLLCVKLDKRRQKLRALTRLRPNRPLTLDYFRDARLQRWVDTTLDRSAISTAFVFSSGMAEYVIEHDGCRRILDMVDIDSEKFTEYAERASWPARLVWAREGRTLLAFERLAARTFDRTLLVSPAECARFAALAPDTRDRVAPVENGVDLQHFSPAHTFPNPFRPNSVHIVFTGTMDYWPNIDAVVWFVREVMPGLLARAPASQLTIVGANPVPEVRALAGPSVTVTGRVDDVRPYVAHAAVVVAPLRIARGIQNKVLEAMAMGRPVVASPQAFEGIRAAPGRELLVADGAPATVQAIVEVLDTRHVGLGAAGRLAMERGYGWHATLDKLDALVDEDASAAISRAADSPAAGDQR